MMMQQHLKINLALLPIEVVEKAMMDFQVLTKEVLPLYV
jgi:hypothetical protein